MTERNPAKPVDKRMSNRGRGAKTPTRGGDKPNAAAIEKRRRDSLDMIVNGASLRDVADQLGVAIGTVSVDYRRALADYYGPPPEEAAKLRAEMTERQRKLIAALMPIALGHPIKGRDGKLHDVPLLDQVRAVTAITRADKMIAGIWGLNTITITPSSDQTELARMFAELDQLKATGTIEGTAVEIEGPTPEAS